MLLTSDNCEVGQQVSQNENFSLKFVMDRRLWPGGGGYSLM